MVKRLLRENTGPNGSLDTDKMARALLTYRNTPNKDLGVSPAQILYGRCLKDHLPTTKDFLQQRKEWVTLKEDREKALSQKYGRIQAELESHSRNLKPLPIGSIVQVQNQKGKNPLKWDRSGVVVEYLGNQQYTIKMDGSGRVSLRNRRFLRKIDPVVPRYSTLDDILSSSFANSDSTVDKNRRSQRISHAPDRFQAT